MTIENIEKIDICVKRSGNSLVIQEKFHAGQGLNCMENMGNHNMMRVRDASPGKLLSADEAILVKEVWESK